MRLPFDRLASRALIVLSAMIFACPCDEADEKLAPGSSGSGTENFLDDGDFEGGYLPRTDDTGFGGQSVYDGRIVFSNLDRGKVQAVLGPGLKLAANTSSTPDVHPVILIFGHQTDTALVLPGGYEPPIGDDYRELMLLIPFVQDLSGENWHNYVVRMYLEDIWAVIGGNQYYGYLKESADFLEKDAAPQFTVSRYGVDKFEASTEGLGPLLADAEAVEQFPNYQAMKSIFQMPIIGTLTQYPGDPYICSYFEFHFEKALAGRIRSQHRFESAFVPSMSSWVALGSLPSIVEGAWQLEGMNWRLGLPQQCKF